MKTYSFKSALTRHKEIAPGPKSVRDLQKHFGSVPPDSARALLIKMGPFIASRDAFLFNNSFAITAENAADFLNLFSEELTKDVVGLGVKQYTDFLFSIKIPVPGLPDVSLPDAISDVVINKVIVELTARLTDSIIDPVGSGYGRCGGMAFAGYDFYRLGWPVDGFGATPPTTGELGDYIFDRLMDSFELNARTFLEWLMILHILPDVDEIATATLLVAAGSFAWPIGPALGAWIGTKVDIFDLGGPQALLNNAKDEWLTIKSKLDGEAAWPIGLIYGDPKSPFDQHQVLAIGYTDSGLGTATLKVWDNNDANNDSELRLDFRGNELKVAGSVKPIKGIFHEEYIPRQPPSSLKLP